MKLSIVIPAYNEEACLAGTVRGIYFALQQAGIEHEILVVNDNSTDGTSGILKGLQEEIFTLSQITNSDAHGYGLAVIKGLENYTGDCVAIMMADASDSPDDLVAFYHKLNEGYDCVFGSRFMKGSKVIDYPHVKLFINRIANFLVRAVFGFKYNDCTNAFKMYRRKAIEGLKPFLAHHFNLTLELPLKAIIRGYTYAVVPNSWTNRKFGVSKLKIKEMGSRYFFIMLYCWIEKYFSRGDFRKR